jgi:hypothetical protein
LEPGDCEIFLIRSCTMDGLLQGLSDRFHGFQDFIGFGLTRTWICYHKKSSINISKRFSQAKVWSGLRVSVPVFALDIGYRCSTIQRWQTLQAVSTLIDKHQIRTDEGQPGVNSRESIIHSQSRIGKTFMVMGEVEREGKPNYYVVDNFRKQSLLHPKEGFSGVKYVILRTF